MKLEVAGGGGGGAAWRSIFAFRFLIVYVLCVYGFFFNLSQFYLHRRYALNALCVCFHFLLLLFLVRLSFVRIF